MVRIRNFSTKNPSDSTTLVNKCLTIQNYTVQPGFYVPGNHISPQFNFFFTSLDIYKHGQITTRANSHQYLHLEIFASVKRILPPPLFVINKPKISLIMY